ncbi:MAG: thiamine phosphate synthase [Myxococcales bacterium]|nr:thiamine phosphate synthase [Myxococcales bacterium]
MENGSRQARLPRGLYALCDDSVRPELPLEEKAQRLLDGGARVLQLRMKRTADREALAAARGVVALCRVAGALCLVNDRVDLALLAGADGAHVGEEDLPAQNARALLGPHRLLGVTARNLAEVRAARAAGADYAGVGPVFESGTKRLAVPLLGLAGLAELARESPLPLVAISGIGLRNIREVAACGVHGAAVASDLLLAPDIAGRARELARAFERGRAH